MTVWYLCDCAQSKCLNNASINPTDTVWSGNRLALVLRVLFSSSLYTGMCHLSTDCLEITDQNELTGLQNPERKSSPSMVNLCFQNWHRCFKETRNGKEMNLSEAEGKRTSFQCEDKPSGLYNKSHHVCTPQLLPAIADSALEHCHPPPQVTAVCDCVSSTSCQQL